MCCVTVVCATGAEGQIQAAHATRSPTVCRLCAALGLSPFSSLSLTLSCHRPWAAHPQSPTTVSSLNLASSQASRASPTNAVLTQTPSGFPQIPVTILSSIYTPQPAHLCHHHHQKHKLTLGWALLESGPWLAQIFLCSLWETTHHQADHKAYV